jgi:hypothetical protein
VRRGVLDLQFFGSAVVSVVEAVSAALRAGASSGEADDWDCGAGASFELHAATSSAASSSVAVFICL